MIGMFLDWCSWVISSARPVSSSHCKSDIVDLLPGIIIKSVLLKDSVVSLNWRFIKGSLDRGSKSSKLEM